jgi:streptogramin lyase
MTAPGFHANAVRVSPLYVTPFDNHWPSEAALTPPQLVVPAPAINEYLGASELDAPASITYSAKPSSGCVNVATVSMKGSLATVTGGLRPALLGTCNIVISDGSSAVTAAIENRIAGPDRTGDATLTTYWPPDLSDVSGTGSDIGAYVRGPNGAIYFWDDAGVPPNIGRITTSGTIVEVPAPSGQRGFGIAAGPDGNLWVASLDFSVDRVTMNGVFTIFPTPQAAGAPMAITAGPDGNLWFTTFGGQQLCRMTTAGVVTEFALPNGSSTSGVYPFISITTGPDGNLWFGAGSAVGRSTPSGTITMFPVTPNSQPDGITGGPDGNIWFAEEWGNAIGRVTPTGTVTEFPLPTPNSFPESIVSAPDGNLWFTLQDGNSIGKISVSGTITEYSIPNILTNGIIMVGSDGNLWLGNGVSMQKLQIP